MKDLRASGASFRTVGEPHPYVSEFLAPDVVVVTNCLVAGEGFGAFDDQGQPTGEGFVAPGDSYIEEIEMQHIDGTWKGRSGATAFDLTCDPDDLPAMRLVGA